MRDGREDKRVRFLGGRAPSRPPWRKPLYKGVILSEGERKIYFPSGKLAEPQWKDL